MIVTLMLIGICFLVFILQLILGDWFTFLLGLVPLSFIQGAWWQIITYMFVHGGGFHIFINMFVLLIFGPMVERVLGSRSYLLLFCLSGIGSALLHLALTGISDTLMIGASGAVFGILTAYGILFPRSIVFMFPGIPLPAILAVAVFACLEFFFGAFGLEPGIANWGHLGGILTGAIFMVLWKLEQRRRPRIEFIWE